MSQYWNLQTNLQDNTTNLGNADTEGYGQISVLLSKYVLKEKGKGLSTNDFTDSYKQKLDSIDSGAQENVLETISINNGNPIHADDDKNININVPTKVSQLENDSNYALNAVASQYPDYRDSYVGKSKKSFQDETEINLGLNSTSENKGISIGENSSSDSSISIGDSSSSQNNGIAIGNNSNAENGGIAIGDNVSTTSTYDVNINNLAKHNTNTSLWEMKTTESVNADSSNIALQNSNGTNLTELDNALSDIDTLNSSVSTIQSLIPNQASSSNKLADKDFVNSSIQTNTANFRGNWANWTDVPSDANDYPPDYMGDKTPTTNDYLVIQDASDYTDSNNTTLSGTWRFKYVGVWETDGKNGWIPEYQVNEEPLTSEQIYAINSGITASKVTSYDNHLSNTNNPHSVTATQVGLGNVDNTSDSDIPTYNGTTKFTTNGAYNLLTDLAPYFSDSEDYGVDDLCTYNGKLYKCINSHNASAWDSDDFTDVDISSEFATKNELSETIDSLDVASVGGSGQFISEISESNGKISATASSLPMNSVNSDGLVSAPTSSNNNKFWATDADGIPDWRDLSGAITTVNNAKSLNGWVTCTTASSEQTKVVTLNGFVLTKGARFTMYLQNDNTYAGSVYLTVDGTNATNIIWNGKLVSNTYYEMPSGFYNCYFDGTQWLLNNEPYEANTSRTSEISLYTKSTALCATIGREQIKKANMVDYILSRGSFLITFENENTYNGTIQLSVNSKSARDIYINGTVSSSTNKTLPAGTYLCYYDNSRYYIETSCTVTSARNATHADNASNANHANSATGADYSLYTYCTGICSTESDNPKKQIAIVSGDANTQIGIYLIYITKDNTYSNKLSMCFLTSSGGSEYNICDLWINGSITSSTNYTLNKGRYLCYFDGTKYMIDTTYNIPNARSANIADMSYSNSYVTCSTSASTSAKTVALDGFVLFKGAKLVLNLETTNTVANATLNINGTGAKTVYINGSTVSTTNWTAGLWNVLYDGTYYRLESSNDSYSSRNSNNATNANVTYSLDKALTCSTSASTASKTVSLSGFTLIKGARLIINLSNANTVASALTLNVNSTGAKTIRWNGSVTSSTVYAMTAGYYNCYYDGTYWNMDSAYEARSARVASSADLSVQTDYSRGNAYCTTASTTQAKVANMRGYVLAVGSFPITFTNANTYNGKITLNVNTKGAKDVWINGTVSSSTNKTLPAGTYMCFYDGTKYMIDTNYATSNARNAGSISNHKLVL